MLNAGNLLLLPVLGPAIGAILCYLAGRKSKKARNILACAVSVAEFLLMTGLFFAYVSGAEASLTLDGVLGYGLSFELNGFGLIFACVTAYMWMMTTLFSGDYLSHARNRNRYYFFLLLTLGATAGVFLSADLFTTFVCFEGMSMASYVCVAHEETPEALRAGGVYLAVAVIGGLSALMGIFMLYHMTGTLAFDELQPICAALFADHAAWFYVCGSLILLGFGAKAGMYPLHIWLPMAHPVAPAPASALLSGIITKTGIFGVVLISTRLFFADGYWGFAVLLLGVVTAFVGGMLAVFSVDLKRTLACSSMSQLGFVFIGIGMMGLLGEENALAVRGTILHMFNHSNLKLVLFMAAGVVLMQLHNGNLNNVRGYGRKKPLLAYAFLMGSLGIAGIPLFNGYVSKTLIHESIVEYIELLKEGGGAATFAVASGTGAVVLFKVIEWLFLITGGMTVAYMTKLFVLLFIEENEDPAKQAEYDANRKYMRPLTAAVLTVSATVLPVLGILPYATQNVLANIGQGFLFGEMPAESVNYFSLTNLQGGLISILIGVFIYAVIIRGWMMEKRPAAADAKTAGQAGVVETVYAAAGAGQKGTAGAKAGEQAAAAGTVYAAADAGQKGAADAKIAGQMGEAGAVYAAAGAEQKGTAGARPVRVYVNRWPKWLDLLTLIYEPVVMHILPGIAAFFCRCLDYLVDGIVVFFRKSTHKQVHFEKMPPREYRLAYYTGRFFNRAARLLNRTILRKRPIQRNFVATFSMRQKIGRSFGDIVAASASFGLFMFAVGVVIVVLYLFLF